MIPVIKYAACWHVYYWAVHLVSLSIVSFYRAVPKESADYYVKKLGLTKSGLATADQVSTTC